MTPYPVKYETLDPVQAGCQMYSDSGHCPQAQPFSWPRPWSEPQSPPHCSVYPLPFYSPPLPHFNAAKLVRNTTIPVSAMTVTYCLFCSEPEPQAADRAGHEVQQLRHGQHQPVAEGQRRGPGVQCVRPLRQDARPPPASQHEVRVASRHCPVRVCNTGLFVERTLCWRGRGK